MTEDALARAERHVREAERHVARLAEIVDEMDRDHHPHAAAMARTLLATLQESLQLMREHLRLERQTRGLEP
ncbi:MAG: hypothetical protein JO110_25615 [Acetobacteraceae bacterium]|nr:hypothetical protein [Acetobacteraceae bacterium]